MAEKMCEYIANDTGFEVYGNREFHRKLQEGTEIEIQESGGTLASGEEEKLPLLF
ncbi:hypothetical protein C0J52_07678 [Blattella germanica]|nr:hypothetical protein C0J52_07678 [Blattella germanica]